MTENNDRFAERMRQRRGQPPLPPEPAPVATPLEDADFCILSYVNARREYATVRALLPKVDEAAQAEINKAIVEALRNHPDGMLPGQPARRLKNLTLAEVPVDIRRRLEARYIEFGWAVDV